MNTIVRIPCLKPRNRFAAVATRRIAGLHRTVSGGRRQQGKQALRRELKLAADGPPDL